MEKVIRDGKVAVLISQGWGAGWYAWHRDNQELLFSPKLVEMVEQNRKNEINDQWILENLGIDMYAGGSDGLEIHWLPIGTIFCIEEYDGFETIRTIEDLVLTA